MTDTQHTQPSGGFFEWMRRLGLTRSDDRWLAGVCGGIARHTRIDPLVIRGVAIVVAILGGPLFLAYAAGWALLPDSRGRIHLERMLRGVFDPAMIGVGILVVLTFVPFARGIWWDGVPLAWGMPGWLEATFRTAWFIAVVAGAIWLVVTIARRMPPRDAETDVPAEDPWTSPSPTPPGSSAPAAGATGPGWAAHESAWGAAPTAGTAPGASDAPRTDGASVPSASGAAASGGWMPGAAGASYGAGASASGAPAGGSTAWDPYGQQREQAAREQAARRHEEHRLRMEEQRRRHAERMEEQRRRRPGAGYVAISLGLAVIAAAVAALVAPSVQASPIVLAFAAGLAVVAVATVVAGIRGRESGGLGFFGVVGVIVLIVTGVFPSGTHVSLVGGTTWDVSQADGRSDYAMLVGGPTLDLSELAERDGGGDVVLWLGVGGATVEIPEDVPVRVVVVGAITTLEHGDDGDDEGGGFFYATGYENAAAVAADADDITTVTVRMVIGSVDVVTR